MSNIDKYTNFISEQIRKGSVTGLRTDTHTKAADKETHVDGEKPQQKARVIK
jgi:hypothetical protein